jgi:hypothetical protein
MKWFFDLFSRKKEQKKMQVFSVVLSGIKTEDEANMLAKALQQGFEFPEECVRVASKIIDENKDMKCIELIKKRK